MPSIAESQTLRRFAPVLLCLPLLSGCAGLDVGRDMLSGLTDTLFGDDDNTDPPATLSEAPPEQSVDLLWKQSIGSGADKKYLKLVPAIGGDLIFVANYNGDLKALKLANGDSAWSASSDHQFSAGPGLSAKSVIMGCVDGSVISYDRFSGEQRWQVMVPSEVQAVPVISNGTVIVRTTDGKVVALRESDGGQLWSVEQSVPALSVRGASAPLVVGEHVLVGAANGKLQALQIKDGKSLWEATIAIPGGRSEVERLVDLDVDPVENGSSLFVASFRGGTAAIANSDGDVIWRNEEVSSHSSISLDRRYLYVSDGNGEVWQLDQRSGAALWRQKDLHNRRLSGAIVYQNYVVTGDFEGWVHWLSTSDGHLAGRLRISESPIETQPVIADGIVYVYAKDGTLAALKIK